MKKALVAILCIGISSGAKAQLYFCNRPSEPYISIFYDSDIDRMRRTESDVEIYLEEMNGYLDCIAKESRDAAQEAEAVLDDWNRTVRRFNNQ